MTLDETAVVSKGVSNALASSLTSMNFASVSTCGALLSVGEALVMPRKVRNAMLMLIEVVPEIQARG
jgi:hypothetical protein